MSKALATLLSMRLGSKQETKCFSYFPHTNSSLIFLFDYVFKILSMLKCTISRTSSSSSLDLLRKVSYSM